MLLGVLGVVVAVLLVGSTQVRVEAAQMTPDPQNPCKAVFNSTVVDISKVFKYP